MKQDQYDLSQVIHLTHNKTQHIIERYGYAVTGFVLTKDRKKCIVDMSAVRWFDEILAFQRMMHQDAAQTPLAAIASRQMRDAATQIAWIKGNEKCAKAIAALPVPEVQWRDLTDDELKAFHHIEEFGLFCDVEEFIDITRAVIAKFKEKQL